MFIPTCTHVSRLSTGLQSECSVGNHPNSTKSCDLLNCLKMIAGDHSQSEFRNAVQNHQ